MTIPETDWSWTWWSGMVAVNVLNMVICLFCFRQSRNAPDGDSTYMKRMRFMGLVFSVVAFYRAIFVSRYLYQYAWFDTLANSSLLIRTLAWGAEMSLCGLIAFAMLRFNRDIPHVHTSSNCMLLRKACGV